VRAIAGCTPIVNDLGNTQPQMRLCLHEESAVSIAQGQAKASDRMMGAVLHSNVGLMHATMSVFNAWGDRAAVASDRRDGTLGRGEAPALDRPDPFGVRSGCAHSRRHRMGQPARISVTGVRSADAGRGDRTDRAASARLRK
jgi:Thiamine pyrophosphate enzyme, N-terminal TPP binding domain